MEFLQLLLIFVISVLSSCLKEGSISNEESSNTCLNVFPSFTGVIMLSLMEAFEVTRNTGEKNRTPAQIYIVESRLTRLQ